MKTIMGMQAGSIQMFPSPPRSSKNHPAFLSYSCSIISGSRALSHWGSMNTHFLRLQCLWGSKEGWLNNDITNQMIHHYLDPLLSEGIDTLVLGCTHYPLLRPAFARILGPEISLVDSAQNCASAVRDLLLRENLQTSSDTDGVLEVALTDPPDNFLQVARDALQLDVGEIQLREVAHGAVK